MFDISKVKTPCYVVDEAKLLKNLTILDNVMEKTGCKILLPQKAFSMYSTYPMISQHLKGTTASGLYEAKLGREEFDGEVHVYSPAYTEKDMNELVQICDHIVFNSPKQWQKFKGIVEKSDRKISCGIRCNPEYSEIETDIYNPCFKNSRLGTTLDNFDDSLIDGIDGLHFHTMCEQGSDVLKRTIPHIEEKFGKYLYNMKWINLGGEHHITRDDYDLDTLIECVNYIHDKYGVQVYLEPGKAVALNAGYLVTTELDKVENGITTLILDASAACHMPDVLEMPYTPPLRGGLKISDMEDEYGIDKDIEIDFDMDVKEGIWKPAKNGRYRYRLSLYTCLAGDIIGDYQFGREINVGDRLVFEDMAIYSMVKNNTFNGIPLPDIVIMDSDGECKVWKHFGYEDFKGRL